MNIVVNGQPMTVPQGSTVAQLVADRHGECGGIAVAVNDAVVPRSAWDTALFDGNVLEILTAVQGG